MATEFEKQVYSSVQKIPTGRVTTYSAVAQATGRNAPRAVGLALSKNKSYLKIPCHRVVGVDGSIKSWAWGVDGKIAALKREGVFVENGRIVDFESVVIHKIA